MGYSALHAAEAQHLMWDYWLPRADLKQEQADKIPGYCTGAYQIPALRVPLDVAEDGLPIEVEARAGEYLTTGEITLRGDVVVSRGNRVLRAPSLALNRKTAVGVAAKGLLIEEPDLIVRGERGEVDIDTSAAVIEDVEFLLVEPRMRGTAAAAVRHEDRSLEVTRGSFTRCEPGVETWRISAQSLKIEEGEIFGTARNAVLRVGDVPVFYTPYLSFPVSDARQSGWLFPAIGFSDVDGLDVTLPYYLNLAPDYDATVMPRYVQDRGMGIETEFRHRSGWQRTILSGAFLPSDDLYNGTYDKDDFDDLLNQGLVSGDFNPADRWLYAMDHQGSLGPVQTVVDYTAVSDRDYFRSLGTTLDVSSQRELERRGEVISNLGGLTLKLWAQRFDRLDDVRQDVYQRVPELAVTYLGALPGPFEFSVGASASRFDRDNDDLVGLQRINGNRLHVDPRLRLPLYRPWGFLTFAAGYRYTQYDLSDTDGNFDDNPDRTIGLGSVDAGLFFEREFEWNTTPLVQTFEPRMYYLYQENEDQDNLPRFDVSDLTFQFDQLFRENRFAGLDRIGDANQLSLGVTSRFLRPASGRELFRASIGTIVYFEDREVSLRRVQDSDDRQNTSAVAGELAATFGPWRLSGSLIWNPHDNRVDEGGAYLGYRTDNNHIFNIGFRHRDDDNVDQTDVSFIWPLSKRYALIGRWNYDIDSGKTIEGLGGIEYNNCCWQIRVIGRRFIDSPSAREINTTEAEIGAFVQVVFKGLAGLGTKIESLLEKSIRGYRSEK
jgi:LPS-assembly protein